MAHKGLRKELIAKLQGGSENTLEKIDYFVFNCILSGPPCTKHTALKHTIFCFSFFRSSNCWSINKKLTNAKQKYRQNPIYNAVLW